ncbi:MAG: protein phosphatase 2C domain-containing protein [Deltaproteobacteria bacterium]|nr:protein phosphatase 2C domain-containing protein [Deltaproteobacteria bacterium]
MELSYSAWTHVGRRSNNEDAHAVCLDLGLCVVADGMGGYEGGEVASQIVIDALVDLFARTERDAEATWPHAPRPEREQLVDRVAVGLRHAHASVVARREGRLAQMGSTASVMAWQGERLVIGHVGDSRVYRLRGGKLRQLTSDHSFAEEARRAGADAVAERYRHMLTRVVGMPGPLDADVYCGRLRPGDVMLLCSDGVWEPLTEEQITTTLARDPASAVRSLVDAAYDAGGTDNMTAVVLRVAGDDAVLA